MTPKQDLSTHPLRPVLKLTIPQRNVTLEQTQPKDRPGNRQPEGENQVQQRNAQNNLDGNVQAAAQTVN